MRAIVVVMLAALVAAPLLSGGEAQVVMGYGTRRDYERGYEMGRRDGYDDARERNYDTYQRGRGRAYELGYEYGRGERDGYEEARDRVYTNRRRGNGIPRG